MKYLFVKANLFLIVFFSAVNLNAEDIDVTQSIRIHELIPPDQYPFTLAVEPALPKNFIAKKNPDDPCWLYWGPEEVLDAYFKDPLSLKVPIIRWQLSLEVSQDQLDRLNERAIRREFKRCGKNVRASFGNWDFYSFCKLDFPDEKQHCAYVGLQDNNWVLFLELVVPSQTTEEAAALELWNCFFTHTRQLPEPLFFKAQGQEMHPGYTLVNVVGREVKAIAERRKSDNKVRLLIIPQDKTIEFKFKEAVETKMGASWHYGEAMLKIEGTYVVDGSWVYLSTISSILISEVDEFTLVPSDRDHIFIKEL